MLGQLTKYNGIKYSLKFKTEDGRIGFLNGQYFFACMNDPESKQIYTWTKLFLYVFVGLRTEQNF